MTEEIEHCSPRLRFPEFRDAGEWKKVILKNICSFFKGKGISKNDISHHGKTPCIRYGELYTSYHEVITSINSYTNCNSNELFFSKKMIYLFHHQEKQRKILQIHLVLF